MKLNWISSLAVILVCTSLLNAAGLVVEETAFRKDVSGGSFQWTEGCKLGKFYPNFSNPSGTCQIAIRNTGEKPVTIKDIQIAGYSVADLREKLQVVWWRIRPNPILPGAYSMVMVRMRFPQTEPLKVKLITDTDESVECTIDPAKTPLIGLRYIAFSKEMDVVHMFVNVSDKTSLSKVFIDGKDVTEQARIFPAFNSVAYVRIKLDKPLEFASRHLYRAEAANGDSAFHMIATWDNRFDISTWNWSPPEPVMEKMFLKKPITSKCYLWPHGEDAWKRWVELGKKKGFCCVLYLR